MADLGAMLGKKVAGVPVWVLGSGGAALVAGVLYLRSKSGSKSGTTSGMGTAQTTVPSADSASGTLNYPPTVVVTPGGASASTTSSGDAGVSAQPSSPQTITLGGAPGMPNSGIWSTNVATYGDAAGSAGPTIPYGTYTVSGSPTQYKGQTIWPIVGPGGSTVYALGENVLSYSGGQGGRGGVGRNDALRHFTPFQTSQVVNTTGRGGLGGLSHSTGISLDRLKSLNPHLLGGRGGGQSYGEGLARIA